MRTETEKSIKRKLDQLKDIPDGFHFDPEEIWQKLDAKLITASRNKKLLWFNAAKNWLTKLWNQLTSSPNPGKKKEVRRSRRARRGSRPAPVKIRQG